MEGTISPQAPARSHRSSLPLLASLLAAVVALMVLGAVVVLHTSSAAPTLPAAPPRAHRLWAAQTTDMIDGNQISSLALYRVAAPPSAVIAYYKDALPGHGGHIGRFGIVVRNGSAAALPTSLQHLPGAFVNGSGTRATARYTFTEYAHGGDDVGIAVDLRRPHGPTLVFVELLSQ